MLLAAITLLTALPAMPKVAAETEITTILEPSLEYDGVMKVSDNSGSPTVYMDEHVRVSIQTPSGTMYGINEAKTGNVVIPCEYASIWYTNGIYTVRNTDEKYGFCNTEGEYLLPCQYDDVSSFKDGVAIVQQGKKYGYINSEGKIIAKCEYDNGFHFQNGYASVKKGAFWGAIDTSGKRVVPCMYSSYVNFYDGLALVQNSAHNTLGYINTSGKLVIPYEEGVQYENFLNGYAVVRKDSLCGLIDTSGELVIPFEYGGLRYFSNGLFWVYKDGKCGLVNVEGRNILPCDYDYIENIISGFAKVRKGNEETGKSGYINAFGKLVIPCEFDSATIRGELVYVETDSKCGIFNKNGEVVVPCIYDQIVPYSNELATVEKDGKYGYVNVDGELVIDCKYDSANSFREQLAWVNKNGLWGLINTDDGIVTPFEHEYDDVGIYDELTVVKKDGKYGYINSSGELVIDCIYDEAESIVGELAKVKKDSLWGAITKSGEVFVPCIYDFNINISRSGPIMCLNGIPLQDLVIKQGYYRPDKNFVLKCTYDRIEYATNLLILSYGEYSGGHPGNYSPYCKGIYTVDGYELFSVTEFQDITTVSEATKNYAWVKQNDKWGILLIDTTMLGDANNDRAVNINDILFIRDAIFNSADLYSVTRANLQMTEDENPSIKHILFIRDIIFGV